MVYSVIKSLDSATSSDVHSHWVALDFETTGIVRGFPNEPWQLGLIAITNDEPIAYSQWETFFQINPTRPFSPRAPGRWTEIRDTLARAPTFQNQWSILAEKLLGMPLVAHNASTEKTILTKRAPLSPFGPWVDTLKLTRKLWPKLNSYALGDLITTFQLQNQVDNLCTNRSWHDALYDACAGAVLLCHILKTLKIKNYQEMKSLGITN